MRYGKWAVIGEPFSKGGKMYCPCKCDCGTERDVLRRYLVTGQSTSCGCNHVHKDASGNRFGTWTLLSFHHKQGTHLYYNCRCDCGIEKVMEYAKFVNDSYTRCKCNKVGTEISGVKIVKYLHGNTYRFQCPYCANTFDTIFSKVSSRHITSCGCQSRTKKDLVGSVFGELTVDSFYDMYNTHSRWKCRCSCGKEKIVYGYLLTSSVIRDCGHSSINVCGSLCENEIKDYILSLAPELELFKTKILDNKEIDIYIPSLNLGIEYNGSKFHATLGDIYNNKPATYHRKKFLKAQEMGIHLITVYDVDWARNKEKIKTYLKSLILPATKVYARDCELRIIDKATAVNFTDLWHLQGGARLQEINYGLYYKDELLSVMSFGKPRYKAKSDTYELQRYCVKDNYTIVGGAHKLLKAFEREYCPKHLISYSDNDYFSGGIYPRLGFACAGQVAQGYYWLRGDQIYNRGSSQSRILAKHYPKLYKEAEENCVSNKENYIMLKLGFCKVYRCGNTRWEKNYESCGK